jgi:hypothetical protein
MKGQFGGIVKTDMQLESIRMRFLDVSCILKSCLILNCDAIG